MEDDTNGAMNMGYQVSWCHQLSGTSDKESDGRERSFLNIFGLTFFISELVPYFIKSND